MTPFIYYQQVIPKKDLETNKVMAPKKKTKIKDVKTPKVSVKEKV